MPCLGGPTGPGGLGVFDCIKKAALFPTCCFVGGEKQGKSDGKDSRTPPAPILATALVCPALPPERLRDCLPSNTAGGVPETPQGSRNAG